MQSETLLVLGRPGPAESARLEAATSDLEVVVGTKAEDLVGAAARATVALCWWTDRETLREVLVSAPSLRWVHIMSAGINHLTSPALLEGEVVVTNGKGVFSASLGEWVLGAILFFAKDFRRLLRSQAEGRWDPFDVVEVAGQTVGIVGYGDIGRAVAERVHPLGMRVLGLTRRGSSSVGGPTEQIFGLEGLRDMIGQSDYVVVTAPLTPETRGMIGEAELAAMKPEAVLINIGRGPIVQEGPLVDVLAGGRIRGAALDVFHREPLPDDHIFYRLDNVLLSPHSADRTPDFLEKAMQLFIDNLGRYRRGETLVNAIDKAAGY